jgi:hypothetical protein
MQIRPLSFTSRRWMLRTLLGAAALQSPLSRAGRLQLFYQRIHRHPRRTANADCQALSGGRALCGNFHGRLRDPQLGLDARSNRAAITATLTIASPLLAASPVQGMVSVSSALRYDAATRALRLDQPKAERLELQGVEGRDAERLQKIGAVVAQELLQGQVLRSFTADELTVGRKTYEIGDITVQDDGIKVQLK